MSTTKTNSHFRFNTICYIFIPTKISILKYKQTRILRLNNKNLTKKKEMSII